MRIPGRHTAVSAASVLVPVHRVVVGRRTRHSVGRPAARRPVHLAGLSVVVVATAVLLASCDGARSQPGAASANATGGTGSRSGPGGGPPSSTADRRAAVEAVYREFWRVGRTFDRDYPPDQWRAVLSRVAVDPLLSRALSGARLQRQNGTVLYGQVIPRPTVVSVSRGEARVADCQDASHAGQADAKTGKPRTVGVARSPVKASLILGDDGRWRVSDVDYLGGRC
jgi:hypothetical protein